MQDFLYLYICLWESDVFIFRIKNYDKNEYYALYSFILYLLLHNIIAHKLQSNICKLKYNVSFLESYSLVRSK